MQDFPLPRRRHTADGRERRLGIELEFAGLEITRVCELVTELYGGRVDPVSRFEYKIRDTRWGSFGIEIDMSLLKERSYLKFLDFMGVELGDDALRHTEDLLARLATTLVPHEIGTPPIPFGEAHEIERLRQRLHSEHALGTRASLRYAFGLQFNPESPALDAATVLNYLRAFLLLVDWLEQRTQVVLARRLSPFVNDFPQSYVRRVLEPDYSPSLEGLIDDYLEENPTRNRPLDMLPLFAHVDAGRVSHGLGDAHVKINPRPTYHYRLPNCLIDDPGWTLAREWRGWVVVDDLAQNPEKIHMMSTDYLEERAPVSMGYDENWAARVADEWLDDEDH